MAGGSVAYLPAVRGQETAKAQLQTACARDRLAHALLFSGPDGVGKQRLAREFAALFACEAVDGSAAAACGSCAACRQLAAGSHPDSRVVTIPDGKKDIRIDAVRELRSFLQLAPLRARRKVAIIPDAHALNLNAQNALLKTLEEPPQRSLLILCTHTPGLLLPTVRSRCQRVQCAPLTDATVAEILEHNGKIPAAEAAVAATCAEGSPGRALQLCSALGDRRKQLLGQLAELPGARYGRIAAMTRDTTARDELSLPLTLMLTWYRDQAVRAIGANAVGFRNADLLDALPTTSAPAAVAGAEAIVSALAQLRRGNPNRQLLLEALLLQLADH